MVVGLGVLSWIITLIRLERLCFSYVVHRRIPLNYWKLLGEMFQPGLLVELNLACIARQLDLPLSQMGIDLGRSPTMPTQRLDLPVWVAGLILLRRIFFA